MEKTELAAQSGVPAIAFREVKDFERWLAEHVRETAGVWLKLAKKGQGVPSLSSDEAVDVGLCFGWISGQRKPLDASQRQEGRGLDRDRSHARVPLG